MSLLQGLDVMFVDSFRLTLAEDVGVVVVDDRSSRANTTSLKVNRQLQCLARFINYN